MHSVSTALLYGFPDPFFLWTFICLASIKQRQKEEKEGREVKGQTDTRLPKFL